VRLQRVGGDEAEVIDTNVVERALRSNSVEWHDTDVSADVGSGGVTLSRPLRAAQSVPHRNRSSYIVYENSSGLLSMQWSTGPWFSAIYCPELNMLEMWSQKGWGEASRLRQTTALLG
jgi:hypothetical protein